MNQRQKEIEALRVQIAKLEEQQEREAQERKALEGTNQKIFDLLEQAGLSLEAFIRFNLKAAKRVMSKIEREEAKSVPATKAPAKKRVAKKAARRGAKRKVKTTVKIPAGKYTIPTEPDRIFEVKDKGPRPKALKAHAEEIGLERFMTECRID